MATPKTQAAAPLATNELSSCVTPEQARDIQLSWPTSAWNFVLQVSTNVNRATDWTNAAQGTRIGSQITVTNSISGQSRFFRLKSP